MPGMGRKGTKMQKKNYQEEILNLIHSGLPQAELGGTAFRLPRK